MFNTSKLSVLCSTSTLLVAFMPSLGWSSENIDNYNLVSKERIGRFEYRYTFTADLTNDGEKNI